MAIYALVGAMAISPIFTSCVDSEETSSVTAIRNANAEQLKAIADLNNAKAASTAAMAAAEAALINAKAEAQKANNEYTNALAALKNTQNEEEKAALAVTIKQAELDLARIEGEIEAQAINIQAALLETKMQLMAAQKSLDNATKDYDEYQKAKLQTLAQEYSNAVYVLTSYQRQLMVEKSRLVKLEAGLVKAEDALETKIAANNNQIALNNIQIEGFKKYTNYNENTDSLLLKCAQAWVAYDVAVNKSNSAYAAWLEAMNSLDHKAADEALTAINKDEFRRFVNGWIDVELEEGSFTSYPVGSVSQYFITKAEWKSNEHKYGEQTYPNYCGNSYSFEYELTADIRQIELAVNDSEINWRKQEITNLNESIKTNQTAYEEAVKATAAAKKAWDEAATADKDAKKAAYETALNTEVSLKKDIENLQDVLASYTKDLNVYIKALDFVLNAEQYNEALQAKIKAYNDASVAVYAESLTAWEKTVDADVVYNETWAEYAALNDLCNQAENIERRIKNLEDDNKALLDEIAQAEKLLTIHDGYQMPYEAAIELQKLWITAKEAIVAAQQVKVNEAKAALDAAMPAEEE